MNNSFSRMNRDTRRKIAIGAGLLALLLVCGIAGFRIFSGRTQPSPTVLPPALPTTRMQRKVGGLRSAKKKSPLPSTARWRRG